MRTVCISVSVINCYTENTEQYNNVKRIKQVDDLERLLIKSKKIRIQRDSLK